MLPKYGISLDPSLYYATSTVRGHELDQAKACGCTWVRMDMYADPFNDHTADTFVTDCLTRGLDILFILFGTGGPGEVMGTFPHDVMTRYKGQVRNFECMNEPDLNGWTPNGYADFFAAASDQVKTVDSTAKMIAGALWKGDRDDLTMTGTTDPLHFVQALASRAAGKFDYISFHGYDDPLDRGVWNIWDYMLYWGGAGSADNGAHGGNVRQWMDANGLANIPIISTEGGGPLLQGDLVTPQYTQTKQATIVSNNVTMVKTGKLESTLIYQMRQTNAQQFALRDGSDNARPAYTAFANQIQADRPKTKMFM